MLIRVYYVYIHTNKINGKKYCGMTNNPSERWRHGGITYKPPKERENTRPFWNAIVKYGWDNFRSEIILETLDRQEAIDKEIETIDKLNLRDRRYGYNVAKGGDGGVIYIEHPRGMLGKPQTEYNNECCRQRFIENNPMYNGVVWGVTHPHPKGFLSKSHSEETKKRISEKLQGRTFTIERNKKISNKLKGVAKSEEHKKSLSNTRKKLYEEGVLKTNCAKGVNLVFPNGETEYFDSIKKFEVKYKTSRTTSHKMLRSNNPYELPKGLNNNQKQILSKLVGCRLIEVKK